MKVGLVIATADEMAALVAALDESEWEGIMQGYAMRVFRTAGHIIYAVKSGVGEIRAAAATQMLISSFRVGLIANFGVCGGLTADAAISKGFVVRAVIHYDYDTSAIDGCEPAKYEQYETVCIPATAELVDMASGLQPAICASGDKFIADPDAKLMLFEKFGADICDMEAAGILLTANRAAIPALLIKVVSDGVTGGADEYLKTVNATAKRCVAYLLKAISEGRQEND
ncbi:MAG: 5'-methylthioadenosine/S-adenosylhomocysteine nucleosidase [Bacteroides sp.]